jgi:glyoxylase-like metal-dependent hydrolase (beta-lactamase superfamily II)/rhodanese-related sulfurtransferase
VLFRQFLDDDLGCASYLVGDEGAGIAAIVDPPYAVEPLLAEADRRGVRIVRVLETHTHADHLSGHGRLALEHDVPVSIHPTAAAEYSHDALEDGTEIALGDVVLRALHTPGHRPEHTCIVVADRSRADEPWLVLTGDSLFVGDAARPDLAVGAREGAEGLYHSLRRLLELPDGVEVYPGHVAGSLCGRAMSSKASSTIGFERRFNGALQLDDEATFVAEVGNVAAPKPPNMRRLIELNCGSFVGATPELRELPSVPDDTTLLDVRPLEAYLGGHAPGALSVPVTSSAFGTKAGFVLAGAERIVLAVSGETEARTAAARLHAVGFLDLDGYVVGGGNQTMTPVELGELERLLAAGGELIDVREREERDGGYIAGSRNIPYRLLALTDSELKTSGPVVTICESGPRAAIAASLLAARGIDARPVLHGGVRDWAEDGGRTVEFRRCGS